MRDIDLQNIMRKPLALKIHHKRVELFKILDKLNAKIQQNTLTLSVQTKHAKSPSRRTQKTAFQCAAFYKQGMKIGIQNLNHFSLVPAI